MKQLLGVLRIYTKTTMNRFNRQIVLSINPSEGCSPALSNTFADEERICVNNLNTVWRSALLFFLVLLPHATQAADVTLQVRIGVGDMLKERQYGSARVILSNSGAAKQCRLVLRAKATRWGEAESVATEAVSLPANSRKRVELPLYAEVGTTEVEAALWEGGQRLAQQEVKVNLVDFNDRLVCVVAPSSTGVELTRDELTALPTPVSHSSPARRQWGDALPQVVEVGGWDDLPATLLGLKTLDALILVGAPPGNVSVEQQSALNRWVVEGGRLIVSAGEDAGALAQSFLAALLPAEVSGDTRWANLRALQLVSGAVTPLNGDVPVPSARPKARPLVEDNAGVPLVMRHGWGRGQVVLLTFNPLREPLASWDGRKELWGTLLRWTMPSSRIFDDSFMIWRLREVVHQEKIVETPSRAQMLTPLLLYGITLILAAVCVVRIAGRKEKAWLALCGIAVVFSFGFYVFFRGKVRAQATLVGIALTDVASDARTANTMFIMELFSPVQSRLDMTLQSPHARFRARADTDSMTMVNHEFTPAVTRLSGDILPLWDLRQIIGWVTTPIDGTFSLHPIDADPMTQTATFRFTNRDRYPLSLARMNRPASQDTNLKRVPPNGTMTASARIDSGPMRRSGFNLPALSQMPPVRSEQEKRRQTSQWLMDVVIRELGWWSPMHAQRFSPYLIALTERPPVAVTLPGFRQEWYHFVRVTPSDAAPSSSGANNVFFFGSQLRNAHWVRRSAEATFENSTALRVERGEVVLELAGVFDRTLVLSGDLEGDADVAYAVYNWKTGRWMAWHPREGASATSPALSEEHFHSLSDEQQIVRLRITVEGSAKAAVKLRGIQWKGREE
jgi:hypothetical protein